MNRNEYVYCTDCKHLKYDKNTDMFSCIYENECDFWDWEDSKPFSERPHYEKDWRED